MMELTDEQRESYITAMSWDDRSTIHIHAAHVSIDLALALRRMGAEALRLKWAQSHPAHTSGWGDVMCLDPRHDWTQAQWEQEADRLIREGDNGET